MSQEINNTEGLKTLSIDELRQYKGLSDLTDAQAQEIVQSLKQLALSIHKTINRE